MTPIKPYLIRAFHEWILANELTPHILVDATCLGIEVPANVVENGKVVLNIRSSACDRLELGNEAITFNAKFGGRMSDITAPIDSILAIYAKENGNGMMFDAEMPKAPKKPALRVVK